MSSYHPNARCECGNPKGLSSAKCRECAGQWAERKAPTPEEIAASCLEIQGRWSAAEEQKRRAKDGSVEIGIVPVVEFLSAATNGYLKEA